MPQVPFHEAPQVEPQGQLNVSASPEAFGGQVAKAVEVFGHQLSHTGDVLAAHALEMQKEKNHDAAKEAFLNASEESGQKDAIFRQLEGKSAVDAYPKYVEDIKAIRTKYMGLLKGDEAKRIFDQDFSRRTAFNIMDGARYAAGQNKRYSNEVNKNVIDTAGRDVALDPTNDERFKGNVKLALDSLGKIGKNQGLDDTALSARRADVESNLWSTRIAALARQDLDAAKKLYKDNKARLTPSDQENVEDKILGEVTARKSKDAADKFSVEKLVTADISSVAQGGEGAGLTEERVRSALGPAKTEDWKFKRAHAADVWRVTHDMGTMTDFEIDARIDKLRPTGDASSDPNWLQKMATYQSAIDYKNSLTHLRQTDPATSVGDDASVKIAQGNLKKDDPATMKALLDARMAAQTRAGIEHPSPITLSEATQLGQPFKAILPGQEIKVLKEMGQKFTKDFGEYAEPALRYTLRTMKLNAEQSGQAARMMKQLGLGQQIAPVSNDTEEVNAAEDAVNEPDKPVPSESAIKALTDDPTSVKIKAFDKRYGAGKAKSILSIGKRSEIMSDEELNA